MNHVSEGQAHGVPSLYRGSGNLYPTHGLGPSSYMNLTRQDDNFKSLVSFSTPALGENIC